MEQLIENYPYRELLHDVISPVAVGAMEQLSDRIHEIYGLNQLLDTPLPLAERERHAEVLTTRLRRIVRCLPPHISPLPNEVFTAVEFLVYEVHRRPVELGEALLRLEIL